MEVLGPDLDDGQHDLGSRGAERHQGEIGDGLVPDLDDDDAGLAGLGVLDGDLLLLGGDHLDGLHELVGDNGHADEKVEHEHRVQQTAAKSEQDINVRKKERKNIYLLNTADNIRQLVE